MNWTLTVDTHYRNDWKPKATACTGPISVHGRWDYELTVYADEQDVPLERTRGFPATDTFMVVNVEE